MPDKTRHEARLNPNAEQAAGLFPADVAILCDEVRARPDGKIDLIGPFSHVHGVASPSKLGPYSLFLRLRPLGEAKETLALSIVDAVSGEGFAHAEVKTNVRNGKIPVEMMVQIPQFILPRGGMFAVKVDSNGAERCEVRFMLHITPEGVQP